MTNKEQLKAKYHEKFRKNIDHKKNYMTQLLERAWNEYTNHPAMDCYNHPKVTPQDREEIAAIMELIKLYQSQIDLRQTPKKVPYVSC